MRTALPAPARGAVWWNGAPPPQTQQPNDRTAARAQCISKKIASSVLEEFEDVADIPVSNGRFWGWRFSEPTHQGLVESWWTEPALAAASRQPPLSA
jgi:hypothetical protein